MEYLDRTNAKSYINRKTGFILKEIVFNVPGLRRFNVGGALNVFQLLPKIDFFARVFCNEIWFVSYKANYNWNNNADEEYNITKQEWIEEVGFLNQFYFKFSYIINKPGISIIVGNKVIRVFLTIDIKFPFIAECFI